MQRTSVQVVLAALSASVAVQCGGRPCSPAHTIERSLLKNLESNDVAVLLHTASDGRVVLCVRGDTEPECSAYRPRAFTHQARVRDPEQLLGACGDAVANAVDIWANSHGVVVTQQGLSGPRMWRGTTTASPYSGFVKVVVQSSAEGTLEIRVAYNGENPDSIEEQLGAIETLRPGALASGILDHILECSRASERARSPAS